MSNALLKSAIKKLSIVDVFLIDCHTQRKENYLPPHIFDDTSEINEQYKVQFINHTKDSTTLKSNNTNSIDGVLYKYNVGFRFVNKVNDEDIKIEFKATFGAIYNVSEDISDDELQSFGVLNVGYNVWPYWRELASSMTSRLKIPDFVIPLYKINSN